MNTLARKLKQGESAPNKLMIGGVTQRILALGEVTLTNKIDIFTAAISKTQKREINCMNILDR